MRVSAKNVTRRNHWTSLGPLRTRSSHGEAGAEATGGIRVNERHARSPRSASFPSAQAWKPAPGTRAGHASGRRHPRFAPSSPASGGAGRRMRQPPCPALVHAIANPPHPPPEMRWWLAVSAKAKDQQNPVPTRRRLTKRFISGGQHDAGSWSLVVKTGFDLECCVLPLVTIVKLTRAVPGIRASSALDSVKM